MPPKTPAWKKNQKAKESKKLPQPAFKGQPRTIADGPKPKSDIVLQMEAKQREKANQKPSDEDIDTTPWIPKPAPVPEVMPGPENRFTKITKAADGVEYKPPQTNETDADFKLKASDIVGMKFGQPKTFADVRKVPKAIPLVAKIKFDIRADSTIFTVEAQFATKEAIDAVYEFLEKEIFEHADKIEIYNTFPRQLIPRDGKSLASLKITGNVMLHVVASGNVKMKV